MDIREAVRLSSESEATIGTTMSEATTGKAVISEIAQAMYVREAITLEVPIIARRSLIRKSWMLSPELLWRMTFSQRPTWGDPQARSWSYSARYNKWHRVTVRAFHPLHGMSIRNTVQVASWEDIVKWC